MGILGGIGPTELIIILVIALLIFGPKNLPKLGASLGKTVKNIRKGMDEDEVKEPTAHIDAGEKDLAQDENQAK